MPAVYTLSLDVNAGEWQEDFLRTNDPEEIASVLATLLRRCDPPHVWIVRHNYVPPDAPEELRQT